MTQGRFVEYRNFKIWVWDNDVEGVFVNGRPTSYYEQAVRKFEGGFLNLITKG